MQLATSMQVTKASCLIILQVRITVVHEPSNLHHGPYDTAEPSSASTRVDFAELSNYRPFFNHSYTLSLLFGG